jgi:hypothetical protein
VGHEPGIRLGADLVAAYGVAPGELTPVASFPAVKHPSVASLYRAFAEAEQASSA